MDPQVHQNGEPSKVLHVRGLPSMCTEAELRAVMVPYGTITRCLILHVKLQGFVQMETVEEATHIVSAFQTTNATIRGKRVYIQFSTRSEISLPPSTPTPSYSNSNPSQSQTADSKQQTFSTPTPTAPNSILLVSVTNMRDLDVTLDNIHQTFKMCGNVLKIITFVAKNGTFKALVQMGSVEEATHAMNSLDSREIFSNCCTLRIGYSNFPELKVKTNGPTSWDFTVPQDFSHPQLQYQQTYHQPYTPPSQAGYLIPQHAQQQGPIPPYSYDSKLVNPLDPHGGLQNGLVMYQQLTHAGASVLLVNNLSKAETTPDTLFNLFGVYGDVVRVKILFNKRDTALIQFSAPHQAHQAYLHLNHLFLHGQEVAISFSKHRSVAMPRDREPSESAQLTKDFTDSPFHRFRINSRGSARRVYIHPPSKVLHVSNIYDDASEEEIRKLFGPESKVQFFVDFRRMAYVCMPTVHDAVLALISAHNQKLGNRAIRVSFSAKNPSSITDDAAKPATSSEQ